MVLKKQEYASVIDLSARDERVIRYLKGETIEIEDGESTRDFGWQLVCVDGYPLGWGKLIRGTLRNKYFSGWRMNA
jgi:NOL1/NOP2/fmu family ribosome biogenesis protein